MDQIFFYKSKSEVDIIDTKGMVTESLSEHSNIYTWPGIRQDQISSSNLWFSEPSVIFYVTT